MARAERRATHACQVCGKPYLVKGDRDEHLRAHHPDHPAAQLVPKQKCEHCGKEFSGKSNLLRHVKAVHDGGRIFNCPHCKGTEPSSTGNRKGNIGDRHCLKCPHRPQHLPVGKDKADEPEECADQAELEAKQQEFRAQTTPEEQLQPVLDLEDIMVDTFLRPLIEDTDVPSPEALAAFRPGARNHMLTSQPTMTDMSVEPLAQNVPASEVVSNFNPRNVALDIHRQVVSEIPGAMFLDQEEIMFMDLALQQSHPTTYNSALAATTLVNQNDLWF